jgi:hypothetical protein
MSPLHEPQRRAGVSPAWAEGFLTSTRVRNSEAGTFQQRAAALLLRHLFATLLVGAVWLPGRTARAATAYPGYTFCASGTKAYLLDMTGKTLHTWTASGSAQTCAYLLPDGSALFPIQNTSCTAPAHDGAYPSGRFQKISWDGAILWDYKFCDSTARAGYDVEPMPNGNILVPADSSTVAKIFEIQPSGTNGGSVVWSYALPTTMTGSSTYLNSVSYNPALDKILVDLQEPQRKLVVIDHSGAGSVVFTNVVGTTGRVHAAAWVTKYFLGTTNELPDGNFAAMRTNNLLVVYNGGAKAVEVSLATSNQVKSFTYAYNDHEGSVQRLPNGNTLLSIGNTTTITELDDNGSTVATLTAPGTIDRAYRYGYGYSGVARLVTNVLTVVSPHGAPSPAGKTTNAYGALVSAWLPRYETNAGVSLFESTGWTLTGAKATNGAASGTTTNAVIPMTNNPTLTWLWKSNYWLEANTNGRGTLSFAGGAPGWNPSTNSVTITAAASVNWHFVAWSGTTGGCAVAGTQIIAPMTQARSLTSTFALDANALAAVRLNIGGPGAGTGTLLLVATNFPPGATATLQHATALGNGDWQNETSLVATTTATNWTVVPTGSNVFYRLLLQ